MLVSFSVENFRSFQTEATLTLVAGNRDPSHENHALAVPGSSARVLRTAVIYGANGAGKSNLFRALAYLKSLVMPGFDLDDVGTGRQSFRFSGAPKDSSSFDIQFIADGRVFRYFIRLDDAQVLQEWLGETVNNRDRCIFERGKDREIALRTDKKHNRLNALATVGSPPNQSFLSVVAGAFLPDSDIGPDLSTVIRWFSSALKLIGPGESEMPIWRMLNDDPTLIGFASDFLESSSTGVERLEILRTEIASEDLAGFLGDRQARQVIDRAQAGKGSFVRARRASPDAWIEADGSEGFHLVRFQSVHRREDGSAVNMDLRDESDGTRRLLDLLPALHQMKDRGGVYFVDEIDRSMHPILVRRLLELFLASCASSPGQLIVTTHESHLLDLDLLRRDEIWFAEKDRAQATRLYSLADFKVRNDLEIRKHYLQGRFGAIPFLGNPEKLTVGQEENS